MAEMKKYLVRDIKMSIVGPGCGTHAKAPTDPIERKKRRLAEDVFAMRQSHNTGSVKLVVQVIDKETGNVEERRLKLRLRRLETYVEERIFNVDIDIATVAIEELKLGFQRKGTPLDDEGIRLVIQAMEKFRDAIYEHQADIWIENVRSMMKVSEGEEIELYPRNTNVPVSVLFDMAKLRLRNNNTPENNTTELEEHTPEVIKREIEEICN